MAENRTLKAGSSLPRAPQERATLALLIDSPTAFLALRAKAAAISVSLEIILRGFLVDTLRRCSQQVCFFIPGLKILSHAIS